MIHNDINVENVCKALKEREKRGMATYIEKLKQEKIFKYFNMPGNALIFKADKQHKVEPVTNGKRKTLSYWVRGPAWK